MRFSKFNFINYLQKRLIQYLSAFLLFSLLLGYTLKFRDSFKIRFFLEHLTYAYLTILFQTIFLMYPVQCLLSSYG